MPSNFPDPKELANELRSLVLPDLGTYKWGSTVTPAFRASDGGNQPDPAPVVSGLEVVFVSGLSPRVDLRFGNSYDLYELAEITLKDFSSKSLSVVSRKILGWLGSKPVRQINSIHVPSFKRVDAIPVNNISFVYPIGDD